METRPSSQPAKPRRGEIWIADLDPTRGHEQGGGKPRPVLVVSVDQLNLGSTEMCIEVPLTSRNRHTPLHVPVLPPEGGVVVPSFVRCEDVRSISTERLICRLGAVSVATMADIEQRLRFLLGLR